VRNEKENLYLEEIESLLAEGHIQEAIEECVKALEELPDSALLWQLKATLCWDAQDWEKAEEAFRQALSLNPDLPSVYNNLGLLLAQTGKINEAEEEFRKAFSLSPATPDYLVNLATTLARTNKIEEAKQLLLKAVDVEKPLPEAYFNLGLIAEKERKFTQAIDYYHRCVLQKSDFIPAWERLFVVVIEAGDWKKEEEFAEKFLSTHTDFQHWGWYYVSLLKREQKELEKAVEYLEKALNIAKEEKFISALEVLGYNAINQNKLELAEKVYQRLLSLNSNKREYYHSLGIIFKKKGKMEEAESLFKQALAISPSWKEPMHSLGNLYLQMGKEESAFCLFKKIQCLDPEDALAWGKCGLLYQWQGKWKEAIEAFSQAISLDSHLTHSYISMGLCYYYLDDFEKAEEYFYLASDLEPLDLLTHSCWIETLIQKKALFRALERYKEMLTKPNLKGVGYYGLGICSFYRYRLEEAKEYLIEATKLLPSPGDAYSYLAWVCYYLGKKEDAKGYLDLAIKEDPQEVSYHYQMGWLKRKLGENFKADLEKVSLLAPLSPLAKSLKAALLVTEDKLDDAKKLILEGKRVDPKLSDFYWLEGELEERTGNLSAALAAYCKSYQLNPLEFEAKKKEISLRKELESAKK